MKFYVNLVVGVFLSLAAYAAGSEWDNNEWGQETVAQARVRYEKELAFQVNANWTIDQTPLGLFGSLPIEITLRILSHLDRDSFKEMSIASTTFRRYATQEDLYGDLPISSLFSKISLIPKRLEHLDQGFPTFIDPTTVRSLTIRGLKVLFDNEGEAALVRLLPHLPTCNNLDLEGNGLGAKGTSDLAKSLSTLHHLRRFNGSNNLLGIEDDNIRALKDAFVQMPTLEILELRGIHLTSNKLVQLSSVFPYLGRLQTLDLSGNQNLFHNLTPDLAEVLAEKFSTLKALRDLRLQRTLITMEFDNPQCIPHIFNGLPNLQRLDLRLNGLGSPGCIALARVLPQMPQLQELLLDNTYYMRDEGAVALAEILDVCIRLKRLDIRGELGIMEVGPRGIEALKSAAARRPDLEIIYPDYFASM